MRAQHIDPASRTLAIRIAILASVLVVATLVVNVPRAFAAVTFDPNYVISDDNMRHYDSMSPSGVQAFLNGKTGALKSLVTKDHNGKKKKASRIIYDACRHYHINPRVMLTLLQKEQSLLTRKNPSKHTLDRAIGAGCPDGKTNKYPGFGNQIWNGARLLDGYGEGKTTKYVSLYKKGMTYSGGDEGNVKPANISTYKLYVYNPSIGAKKPYGDLTSQKNALHGNASFWYIWRRYFGSSTKGPSVRPVYRFYHRGNGSHLLTSSQQERYHLIATGAKTYKYQGAKFTWKTGAKANTVPVYRLCDKIKHTRTYTSSKATMLKLKADSAHWKYEGVAFKVSSKKPNTIAIYRFRVRRNNTYVYTGSLAEKKRFMTGSNKAKFVYKGVAWRIAK